MLYAILSQGILTNNFSDSGAGCSHLGTPRDQAFRMAYEYVALLPELANCLAAKLQEREKERQAKEKMIGHHTSDANRSTGKYLKLKYASVCF